METAEDAVISRKRLLTPCVDSFSKEVMFCVDSFKRSETVGANLLWPFKSLLSMLIAKSMEFRPSAQKEKHGVCAVGQSRLQHDKQAADSTVHRRAHTDLKC